MPTDVTRTNALAACAAGLFLLAQPAASIAQPDYPDKPVRILVPYPAGGPVDVVARRISESLSRQTGQPVIVDNRPGANGIIGATACKAAAPDGYTLCAFLSDAVLINPSVYKSLAYEPGDFSPVAEIARIDSAVVVASALPIDDLRGLARHDAANPGKLNWGHFGTGSSSHLHMTQLNRTLGSTLTDIPYQGGVQTLHALLAGEVHVSLLSYGLVAQHIGQGKLRALAALGEQPSANFAQVPLLKDQGFPFWRNAWIGMFAPAGTPEPIVAQVNGSIMAALADPALRDSLSAQGLTPTGTTPEQMGAMVAEEFEEWAAVIRAANVSLD